jgi:multidrug efflux pump subunit AcrA (membrane-fusion protein)
MLPAPGVLVSRGLLYLIAVIIVAGVAWASVTRVNMVVRAHGHLAPEAEPIRLSVSQGGIVSKVMVEVGSKVTAGQPMLELDAFREAADADADRHELDQARGESARYSESARMLKAATDNLSQELASEDKVMKLMVEQAEKMREGYEGGAVSLFEMQAKQREVAETQAHLSQLDSDLTRSQADSLRSRRLVRETDQKIQAIEIKLSRDVEAKQKTVLTAPTAGIVTMIASMRAGRYLAANDVAATINPSDEPLLAEVWIPNDSMRRVKPHLPVRMKLNAYPYQQFGELPGTLISVDPDADQAGTYRAWIRPARLTLSGAHGPERLSPGLELTAEMVVDERTILDVVLDPIRRVKRGFSIGE